MNAYQPSPKRPCRHPTVFVAVLVTEHRHVHHVAHDAKPLEGWFAALNLTNPRYTCHTPSTTPCAIVALVAVKPIRKWREYRGPSVTSCACNYRGAITNSVNVPIVHRRISPLPSVRPIAFRVDLA